MSSGRRILRGVAILAASLLLAVVVLWLGLRIWALHWVRTAVPEFEAEFGSLDPKGWARRPIPPDENGARYFEAAALLIDPADPDWKTLRLSLQPDDGVEPGSAAEQAVANLETRYETALGLWVKGGRKSRCAFEESLPEPIEKPLTFQQLLSLTRVQAALARRDIAQQRLESASSRLLSIVAAAGCLQEEPSYIAHLTGLAIERMALREVKSSLAAGHLDDALATLRARFESTRTRSAADYLRIEAAIYQPEAWWRSTWGSPREDPRSWFNPFSVAGISAASAVRGAALTLETLDEPSPPDPTRGGRALRPWQLDRLWHQSAGEAFWKNERLSEGQRSVRALAIRAMKLREEGLSAGRYPVEAYPPEPTPLAEESIVVKARGDGSIELSLPESAARWNAFQEYSEDPRGRDLAWVWILPPLDRWEPLPTLR